MREGMPAIALEPLGASIWAKSRRRWEMTRVAGVGLVGLVCGLVALGATVFAQQMPAPGNQMHHPRVAAQSPFDQGAAVPALSGQDAFGAIQEVVRILEADPATDWSKVNLERLRQHLIDMNEVTLRSEVKAVTVPGGLAMDVTGSGRTAEAIRGMVAPHAGELDQMKDWSARTEPIPGGLRLTVVARNPDDAKTVGRIRGLGFIGLLVQGAHHQPHHLAMAKGEDMGGHSH
jgi:hypothetical protein